MKHLSLTLVLLSFWAFTSLAQQTKVLFIGNSYTGVNDLPNMFKNLALSLGDSVTIDSNTPGGFTFNQHSVNASTLQKIQQGNWDFIILQGQSQEPAFPPSQVSTQTYPYAKKLDSLIQVYNPCAETVFYMTWGRKNGDASNCASYPVICTYDGMQQRLRESYLEMTQDNQATCAPVGVAWRTFRNLYPATELYQTDESHPLEEGTYLAACVFYSTIFRKSCQGAQYMGTGITNSDGFNLQTVASATVLDSLENWQQYGSLPAARFNFTQTANQVNFTNQSLRATQYSWNFGDGSALSTQNNPQHTYTSTGQYIVTLTAQTACGESNKYTDTITVSAVPNGIDELENDPDIQIHYQLGLLKWATTEDLKDMTLYDAQGKIVYQNTIRRGIQEAPLSLATGIYIIQFNTKRGQMIKSRFAIVP
ncbi:MAG: PKD domain-containing protein [Bacteroidetes bacterium]|nr:PKD domain-containing protein [Bacteroidota bacterium]